MDGVVQTNIHTIRTVCEILLDKYTEIFHPCWLVNLEKEFPKTSRIFKKDECCGYHVATFKGSKGLANYAKYSELFKNEYENLSFWQRFFMYFSIPPFSRDDIIAFSKRLDLNKNIEEIVQDAVNISAKDIGTKPKSVLDYLAKSGSRDTYDNTKALVSKVLSCLI